MTTPMKYGYREWMSQMARDTRALTDEVEHFDEPTNDMKRAARRVVAANAADAKECALFLDMCGLHPSQWNDAAPVASPPRRLV